ncbi:MAG: hypothetical protein J6C97_04255 [Clostridia bacterium]|nr:hypothetical protein [Clostridia bacterium]
MKNKLLIFLFVITLIIPCAFLLGACDKGSTPPQAEFLYYDIYIKGEKTTLFECGSVDIAITPQDITIKSVYTDESKNEIIPFSEFTVSVLWSDENWAPQTTLPNFWTNGTGDTSNDLATTYSFTLTHNTIADQFLTFEVIIGLKSITNCRVRIYDGNQYQYSAQMVWAHNYIETNPDKHFKFEVENLDANYDKEIQWALIEKDVYDALSSPQEKKDYVLNYSAFYEMQVYTCQKPGTYYVFAIVPDCDNITYGIDKDGRIYDYATLTIVDREIERVKQYFEYDYNADSIRKENTSYGNSFFGYPIDYHIDLFDEIVNVEERNLDFAFYGFNGTNWQSLLSYEQSNTTIKVHAVKENDVYKWVVLKDVNNSLTEWVYVNEDGTKSNDLVADNSKIELIDYVDLYYYTKNSQITIPVYYKVKDMSEFSLYYDCSTTYETEITIKKRLNDYFPYVKAGTHPNVPNQDNLVEMVYGELFRLNDHHVVYDPWEIVNDALKITYHEYTLIGCDYSGFTNGPREAYVTTGNPNVAWKVDEQTYNSVPITIYYQIHKAVIQQPEIKEISGVTKDSGSYIQVLYDSTCQNYKLNNFLLPNNQDDYQEFYDNGGEIGVYVYEVTNDNFATQEQLISTVKEKGTRLYNNYYFTNSTENVLEKTFIVLFDIQEKTSVIWNDAETGTTEPYVFKIKVVDSLT